MKAPEKIKIRATVNAPVEQVWHLWNTPEHICKWNAADPSWHCPSSENDLRNGGTFKHRMEARDGSAGFDFEGRYDQIEPLSEISYTMSDGRRVSTRFTAEGNQTAMDVSFDPETENSPEDQKNGWQAILNHFAAYAASQTKNDHVK